MLACIHKFMYLPLRLPASASASASCSCHNFFKWTSTAPPRFKFNDFAFRFTRCLWQAASRPAISEPNKPTESQSNYTLERNKGTQRKIWIIIWFLRVVTWLDFLLHCPYIWGFFQFLINNFSYFSPWSWTRSVPDWDAYVTSISPPLWFAGILSKAETQLISDFRSLRFCCVYGIFLWHFCVSSESLFG